MNKTSPIKNKKIKKTRRSSPNVNIARQAGLKALLQVFDGRSLSSVQLNLLDKLEDQRDCGLAKEIVNGVLRWRWQLAFFVSRLLNKPLKSKDLDVQLILLMALYELLECRTPDYAIINEAVELVRGSRKKWAASLVNAILRRFTREKEQLLASMNEDVVKYSHPDWILNKIKKDWPDRWRTILEANNQRPAFWLRVNQTQNNISQYQQLLTDMGIESTRSSLTGHALKLPHGVDVVRLPEFNQGAVSIQDAGAQLAADLLNVSAGQSVLDLCAAPGGKTCHILESCSALKHLLAIEIDALRMQRVSENLQRLNFIDDVRVHVKVADVRDYKDWWNGVPFERILIDAPCSASGVIRRHPDIKTLRRESDIANLVTLQAEILASAWQMLVADGQLLYVTCSVFKDENQLQIENFIKNNTNAAEIEFNADWGKPCEYGRQLFPGEQDADGFYFCLLQKIPEEKCVI